MLPEEDSLWDGVSQPPSLPPLTLEEETTAPVTAAHCSNEVGPVFLQLLSLTYGPPQLGVRLLF